MQIDGMNHRVCRHTEGNSPWVCKRRYGAPTKGGTIESGQIPGWSWHRLSRVQPTPEAHGASQATVGQHGSLLSLQRSSHLQLWVVWGAPDCMLN